MDPNTLRLMQGSAGAGAKVYVEDVFSTWLYTGNGNAQTITNGIDLAGEGGMAWFKTRSVVDNHRIVDTVRGSDKGLRPNSISAEGTNDTALTSFNSNGFSVGSSSETNYVDATLASWTFRKQAKFFDIVTYVGNGGINPVSHSLGSVPGFIIIKKTSDSGNWAIAARYPSATNGFISGLSLNSTSAALGSGFWPGAGAITSTTFNPASISDHALNQMNDNGSTYVAYLFAHDAGGFGASGSDNIISCGSYTGNGSTPGPTVTLGWEPQWLLIKQTTASSATNWVLLDSMRGLPVGGNSARLNPNTTGAEVVTSADVDLLPNGFQLQTTNGAVNASGGTYIYIAIRRGPMKTPTDATKVFSAVARTGTGANATINVGFAPDFATSACRTSGEYMPVVDKLRGSTKPLTWQQLMTSGELSGYAPDWFLSFTNTGVTVGPDNTGGVSVNSLNRSLIQYYFRRAPGFFDMVAYTGTGSTRTVSHNLGVTPELIIIKVRDSIGDWIVYPGFLNPASFYSLNLNQNYSLSSGVSYWSNTNATSSAFTVNNQDVNQTPNTYIAYLFASCAGISKVGSYTGSGTTKQIDCGFTNGARFVLIKRTDSTGDWYVWDSARGIVAGNDPYLLLNSSAAEVTGTDYIDTYSAGFEISSTAPDNINGSGATFMFLAVA